MGKTSSMAMLAMKWVKDSTGGELIIEFSLNDFN